MRSYLRRLGHSLTGDWRYPAALAALIFAVVFSFSQYRDWTREDDAHSLTQVVIHQNDDLRKQIDAFSTTSACRSQINATVNSTFGQVINVQGQETAAVGQLIVAIFQQDRPALAEGVTRLAVINQLAAAANRNYQEALDRQANANALCVDETTTTTTQEHA